MTEPSATHTDLVLEISSLHYDNLIESVAKANALLHILLLFPHLEKISAACLHDFLWALSDYLKEIACLTDNLKPEPRDKC